MTASVKPPAEESASDLDAGLLRSTASITAGNVVSRVTGFVRVLAVGAALGTTFLGNTYQTSNLVSNILFELLAAGLLSSVLVPTFVRFIDAGERKDAEHVAGAVLGVCLAVLGTVLAAGLLLRPLIMRLLTVAVLDPEVRRQEVALGSFLLWFFLPQLLLYAAGAVATALLNGARKFMAPAFAPVANNIIVIATMGLFFALHGPHGGFELTTQERLVLAIGTTGGVLAMTAVSFVAAWRAGLRLRPQWDPRHPAVRALARPGAWAVGFLALNQLLIAVTLVLANRVAGGVVAYQIAYTFFLLPYAVLAQPMMTALFPRLSSDAVADRWQRFASSVGDGVRFIAFVSLPASALMAALARPALQVMQLGALDKAGAELVSRVLAAYALGLVGWSVLQLLTRAFYAAHDTRTPTLAAAGLTALGIGLMLWWFSQSTGDGRVVVLGLANSTAMIAGAAALLLLLGRHIHHMFRVGAALVRSLACAAAAYGAARLVVEVLPSSSRAEAALTVVVGAVLALVVYAGLQWVARAPEFKGITSETTA
ncbi:MAG: murein biosynthesis integral membrane protein MurJ [Acidimicrobiia bacterium]|nr:murein biosynthesis integral membrane protein MurJ [Acidimicrobiia bacterium]